VRDSEKTKLRIIETAGRLFNHKGYKATSLSDITSHCNLTKGAIYRHFEDKSSLEKAALLHMLSLMMNDMLHRIRSHSDAPSKLLSIIDYFESYGVNPPFEGGCPLMNASVEADDNNLELKEVVKSIMNEMHRSVSHVVENGMKRNQLKNNIDANAFASLMISSLEGSVMMLKVMDNDNHLKSTIRFLKDTIQGMKINSTD